MIIYLYIQVSEGMSHAYVFKFIIVGDTGKKSMMKVSERVVFSCNSLIIDSDSSINRQLVLNLVLNPFK